MTSDDLCVLFLFVFVFVVGVFVGFSGQSSREMERSIRITEKENLLMVQDDLEELKRNCIDLRIDVDMLLKRGK